LDLPVWARQSIARERPTLFKSIIGTLNHSYVVDLIWQAHLEGRAHGFTRQRAHEIETASR
jgi:uncharacterized damage-inducible protein DinB